MKKSVFLVIIVCVAMVSVHTGCTEKKVESGDSTATDSTDGGDGHRENGHGGGGGSDA